MKILFLGDIVSTPGRKAITQHVPALRQRLGLTAVIANGENATQNRGITAEHAAEILAAGVDVITLGDHTFDQKNTEQLLATNPKIIRPANYPAGTAGRGAVTVTLEGKRITIINLMGRVFMKPLVDCPFQTAKKLMAEHILGDTCDALIVDMHAEATSEKCIMGHLWDGHASLVTGTHTHSPTADAYIKPLGTAFHTDAGMCGDYNSCLGVTYATAMPSFTTGIFSKFEGAQGEATLCGTLVEVNAQGLATKVEPLRIGGILTPTHG